jgi:LacI family transcriptional regulator
MPRAARTPLRPASQRDIAKALQIGQCTVSRAFGAPGYITDDLKAKVLATAERLGYRPNQGARAMRLGRFDHVVLVQSVDPQLSWMPHHLLHGIQHELSRHDRGLLVANFPVDELADESAIPRTLRERSADGILINYNINEPPRLADIIKQHRIPTVWINAKRTSDAVHPDDLQAGGLVAQHLIGLGHRRILYFDMHVLYTQRRHFSRVDRLDGWRTVMASAGAEALELLPTHYIAPNAGLADYCRAALERLRPSAVVTYGAVEAAAMHHAALSLGWTVPGDLSLASFDHEGIYLGVELTVALSPHEAMGRAAAAMLLRRQASNESQATEVLPYTLAIRNSTGAPAKP